MALRAASSLVWGTGSGVTGQGWGPLYSKPWKRLKTHITVHTHTQMLDRRDLKHISLYIHTHTHTHNA